MFKKILWTLFIAISLFLTGISLFLFLNKDFIKNQTINALNAQLDAEVAVQGNIDLTFFSSFPQINLQFEKVYIEDKLRMGDTLAMVKQVALSLNPISILKKDYTIEGITIRNGFIHLYTDINGLNNYNIIQAKENEPEQATLLKLQHINLENVHLRYDDKVSKTYVDLFTKSSIISGTFYEKDFTLKINTNILNKQLRIDQTSLLAGKNIQGELVLNYSGLDGCILFDDNAIQIEGNTFHLQGDVCTKTKNLNIQASAEGKDLQKVLALIPTEWLDASLVKGNGTYAVTAAVSGNFDAPKVHLDYLINNGTLEIPEQDLSLKEVSIKGSYSNISEKNGSLHVDAFNCTSLGSQLNGSFQIPNLGNIVVDAKLNGLIQPELLNKYIATAFDIEEGSLAIQALNVKIAQQKQDSLWKLQKIEGEISIQNIKGRIHSLELPFSCNGDLKGKDNFLSALDLKIDIGENNLAFDGELRNLIELVLNQKYEEQLDLGIIGSLQSKHFNLNDFLKDSNTDQENNGEPKSINLPPINGKLSLDIDKFIYQNLEMSNVEIAATASNTAYTFKINNAETLGGKLNGTLLTNVNNNNFEVNLRTNIYAIDVQKMFEAFDNFGQEEMGSDNIKGQLTSQLSLSAVWKNFSDFDPKSFVLSSHVVLKDGELMNFSPLMSLSGKLDVEQLEHLYFTDLESDFFIKDEIIQMPMTEIQSNLLSLSIGGKHHFDNRIDYKLVLNLKNLLAAKFKKKQTTDENFVNDIHGGINIYISMTGTMDDPIISYDRTSVKDKIKEDFKAEKEEFKNLFKKNEKSEFEKKEIKFEEQKEEDKYLEWEEE